MERQKGEHLDWTSCLSKPLHAFVFQRIALLSHRLERCWNNVSDDGVEISSLATERHPSVRKTMKVDYNEIRHEYDDMENVSLPSKMEWDLTLLKGHLVSRSQPSWHKLNRNKIAKGRSCASWTDHWSQWWHRSGWAIDSSSVVRLRIAIYKQLMVSFRSVAWSLKPGWSLNMAVQQLMHLAIANDDFELF